MALNLEKVANNVADLHRYERKFLAEGFEPPVLMHLIKMHPANFREIFHVRSINNIYFDTPGHQFVRENLSGSAARKKVRIRWYGSLFGPVNKSKLEVKIKQGLVGKKASYALSPFEVNAGLGPLGMETALEPLPDDVRDWFHFIEPTLLNQYQRRYFLSADGHFRITVDYDMLYYRLHKNLRLKHTPHRDREHAVVELKYPTTQETAAAEISSLFPFRMTRCSKYVNGMNLINF